jgi:hypothetical protein
VQPAAYCIGLVAIACVAACATASPVPPATTPSNQSNDTTVLADLCSVLERVIEAAPSGFTPIQGDRIPTPDGYDRAPWFASTLAPAGGRSVVVHYAWDIWKVQFEHASFTQDALVTKVAACPAVAGWRRGPLNESRPHDAAPLQHGRIEIAFDTYGGELTGLQVNSCKTAEPCMQH